MSIQTHKYSTQNHKNIIALVVYNSTTNKIFIGKHADGPFKGKWGIPSIDGSVDRRPQRVAELLGETAFLGSLGTRNTIKVIRLPTTPLGLQLYKTETTLTELPDVLENVCRFMQSCFPVGSNIPPGLIPWTHCKWISLEESCKPMDPFALDAKQQLQIIV
jgi:hypothetical protein